MTWQFQAAILSCIVLGLRHGFDYDHLAALTDITALQRSWKGSMRLGLVYATGHAFTVVSLGAIVITLRHSLPGGLDDCASRVTGATLVVLGVAVIVSLMSPRHAEVASRGRWALAITSAQHLWWRLRRRVDPSTPRPATFTWAYSGKSVFGIGILHGLGAETPSQLMLFLVAASLGGTRQGLLGLIAFAVGLIAMNALMTACLGGAFRAAESRKRAQRWVAVSGAVYSLFIGLLFLFGGAGKLPPL